MEKNLPLDKQNIDDFAQDDLSLLIEKYNISVDGEDEDGRLVYVGNRDDLRNFFIEKDKNNL